VPPQEELPQIVWSGFAGLEQVPSAGLQVPALWQLSEAVQVLGLLPAQVPLWQVSVWVQALLSLQVVPSVFAKLVQLPAPEALQA